MKKLFLYLFLALTLTACASDDSANSLRLADIDLTGLDSNCASGCVNNYSYCVDRISFWSFRSNAECKNVLKLCSQTCKPRRQ